MVLLYLTAVGALEGGYSDETLEQLSRIAKKQDVNYVVMSQTLVMAWQHSY